MIVSANTVYKINSFLFQSVFFFSWPVTLPRTSSTVLNRLMNGHICVGPDLEKAFSLSKMPSMIGEIPFCS